MTRTKRILYDDSVYHIIQRGHNKDSIFRDLKDREIFKDFIRKYKKNYPFDIYHYCIMSNHFHLLIRIRESNHLAKIMSGITQSYSYHYRRRYNRIGYVYQNRYKSISIENESYLLECGRYIERNPLRAGMVRNLADYYYSSYNFYARGIADDIITENPLYDNMGRSAEERQRYYRKNVLEPRPYENILDKALL